MTREWRTAQVMLRSDVVEALERKYSRKIQEVLEELAYQDVCKRVLNRCNMCWAEVYLFVLQDDWKSIERFGFAKGVQCRECNPKSQWRKVK